MFTLFDLLQLVGFIGGLVLGIALGADSFGIVGGIVGGIGGFFIGAIIGRLPLIATLWLQARQFKSHSSDELRQSLHRDDCLTPNLHLLELQRRGEDIQTELPLVLQMLVSDHSDRRGFGWAALTSAFPDVANQISGYNPMASKAECKKHVDRLTNAT